MLIIISLTPAQVRCQYYSLLHRPVRLLPPSRFLVLVTNLCLQLPLPVLPRDQYAHYNFDQQASPASPVNPLEEEGEVSGQETGTAEQEPVHVMSEEQNHRETMRLVRSYMGWNQVPEFESSASSQYDDPFAGPRTQSTGDISVQLPSDNWFC